MSHSLRTLLRGQRPVGDALPAVDRPRPFDVHPHLAHAAQRDQEEVFAVRDAEPERRRPGSVRERRLAELAVNEPHRCRLLREQRAEHLAEGRSADGEASRNDVVRVSREAIALGA